MTEEFGVQIAPMSREAAIKLAEFIEVCLGPDEPAVVVVEAPLCGCGARHWECPAGDEDEEEE